MTKQRSTGERLLRALGSYQLAIACLVFLFVLTVFGTLHQVDHGLYDAKQTYFNSLFLWAELDGLRVPYFPGGVTSMSLLTLNLIVGGILRIRWTLRNTGVIVIHFGIVFLLISGLVKLTTAEEGHLTLMEGDRQGYFQSYTRWEVAVWEVSGEGEPEELLIPDELLSDLGDAGRRTFTSPDLPFELVLSGFVKNCDVLPKGPRWKASGEVIDGYGILALPPETEAERNLAGLHAEVLADGRSQRAILHGAQRAPWVLEAAGRRWAIDMRHERYPMPYEITLDRFEKEDHPGITMAKAFRSFVTRTDERGGEKVLIQMNEPLRDGGLVLFQSSWGPSDAGPDGPFFSVFSVVRNPSDKWPEYSLWVIALGLLLTFGQSLLRFTRKQLAPAS
jgi:hypothetical protein